MILWKAVPGEGSKYIENRKEVTKFWVPAKPNPQDVGLEPTHMRVSGLYLPLMYLLLVSSGYPPPPSAVGQDVPDPSYS